jgi:hypothetical protein
MVKPIPDQITEVFKATVVHGKQNMYRWMEQPEIARRTDAKENDLWAALKLMTADKQLDERITSTLEGTQRVKHYYYRPRAAAPAKALVIAPAAS